MTSVLADHRAAIVRVLASLSLPVFPRPRNGYAPPCFIVQNPTMLIIQRVITVQWSIEYAMSRTGEPDGDDTLEETLEALVPGCGVGFVLDSVATQSVDDNGIDILSYVVSGRTSILLCA